MRILLLDNFCLRNCDFFDSFLIGNICGEFYLGDMIRISVYDSYDLVEERSGNCSGSSDSSVFKPGPKCSISISNEVLLLLTSLKVESTAGRRKNPLL